MQKNNGIFAFTLILCLILTGAAADAQVLKIGTLAPTNTPWHSSIMQVVNDWREISDGKVILKVYSGGTAGEEDDMVRKMRIRQLQGAVLSGIGLAQIAPETLVLNLPLLFNDQKEFNYVIETMGDDIASYIEKRGFKLVALQVAGWVTFFGRDPIQSPKDLHAMTLAIPSGEDELKAVMEKMGYTCVPASTAETLPGLQTGMLDALYQPIVMTAAMQWFGAANHMSNLNFAPLVGGLVIDMRAWNRIPDEYKSEFMESTKKVLKDLHLETERVEQEAIEIMQQNGLVIDEINPGLIEDWKTFVKTGYDALIGDYVPINLYENIAKNLEEYRSMSH